MNVLWASFLETYEAPTESVHLLTDHISMAIILNPLKKINWR